MQPMTLVGKCPLCNRMLIVRSEASTNTFGGTLWSDGFLEAPMGGHMGKLSEHVQSCGHCHGVFWMEDMETEVADWTHPPDLGNDFSSILDQPRLTVAKEIFARQRIWWQLNKDRRQHSSDEYPGDQIDPSKRKWIAASLPSKDKPLYVENLNRLLVLVAEGKHHLLRAEIHIALGQFEPAAKELDSLEVTDGNANHIQDLREKCLSKDSRLTAVLRPRPLGKRGD